MTGTDIKVPLLRTINGQKAFSFSGNSLERETKSAPSLKFSKKTIERAIALIDFISTFFFIDFVLYHIVN